MNATIAGDQVIAEKSDALLVLYQRGFGQVKGSTIYFSLYEALYLLEKEKLSVGSLSPAQFQAKATRKDKSFMVKYPVYRDLRDRGYIVKSALKYGAEFRVYDKGPGKDHAKWVVFPVAEKDKFSWHEFSAKNRVAHSTRKKLMIGVVDEEQEVTYFEVSWTRP